MSYQLTIQQFTKMLHNLETLLDKGTQYAETKKIEPEVLLQSRLAPDQFPFVRQVQVVCDTAKLCASRLANKEAPSNPDTEKTIAELKTRIKGTVTYLESFNEKDFDQAATRHVTQARWEGQYITGEEYLNQHAIPNFYFHMTTAYAILRHNGVEVGKKDYLGKMPFKK